MATTTTRMAGAAPACETTGRGVLVWFRRDLRLHDNKTLSEAASRARELRGEVHCCYVHRAASRNATDEAWHARMGGASLAWLGASLRSLDRNLGRRWGEGGRLVYRECDDDHESLVSTLAETARACGCSEVYFGRCYEPKLRDEENHVQLHLRKSHGIPSRSFASFLLHEPQTVSIDMRKWSGHFGTLMPFYKACEEHKRFGAIRDEPALPVPEGVPVADASVALARSWTLDDPSTALAEVRARGWARKIEASWAADEDVRRARSGDVDDAFGEARALGLLDAFIRAKLSKYESSRGYADARAVSKLSPYIHFGQLSVRLMMRKMARAKCEQVSKTFWRRLVWRDLAYWQLHHWPDMADSPIRKFHSNHDWSDDGEALARWQTGQTGFPMVDAGMRELWHTGWMQQNARMCCALFLTEYLNLHWVEGAKWFHNTLFDADLAINSMMWQNAGKSGLDQWNFTISPFGKTLDPTGAYIKRWVPELGRLPKENVHEPWEARPGVLACAGVVLGQTYPHRLTLRRRENAEASERVMRLARDSGGTDEDGYDVLRAPNRSCRGRQNVRIFTKRPFRDLARTRPAPPKSKPGPQQKKRTIKGGRKPRVEKGRTRVKVYRQLTMEEVAMSSEMRASRSRRD